MDFSHYIFLVNSDLYRHSGSSSYLALFSNLLFNPSFKYTFWMRTCAFLHTKWFSRYGLYHIAKLFHIHYTYKYAISIHWSTPIESGFYIGHFSGIFVNNDTIIGKNCNISQGVTLGRANRGSKKGTPVIGDNVYIAPGTKIIGNIHIGNNVAIGANCVVTKDIEDNAVVVGVPGKVISYDGSVGYINRTNYGEYKIKAFK